MQAVIASVYWLACCSDTGSEASHHVISTGHLKLITVVPHSKLIPMLMVLSQGMKIISGGH